MVSVRKFFCWDLYTASVIIGWLSIAISCFELVGSYLVLDNLYIMLPGKENYLLRRNFIAYIPFFCAVCVADIIGSVLLILAVFKRNHFYVIPWLINGILLAILIIGSVLYTSFISNTDIVSLIEGLVAAIIRCALLIYAWLAVYSFYGTLRNLAISKNQLPA